MLKYLLILLILLLIIYKIFNLLQSKDNILRHLYKISELSKKNNVYIFSKTRISFRYCTRT